jgi:hypothetical protein
VEFDSSQALGLLGDRLGSGVNSELWEAVFDNYRDPMDILVSQQASVRVRRKLYAEFRDRVWEQLGRSLGYGLGSLVRRTSRDQ